MIRKLEDVIREHVEAAIAQSKNKTQAAEALGISRSSVNRYLLAWRLGLSINYQNARVKHDMARKFSPAPKCKRVPDARPWAPRKDEISQDVSGQLLPVGRTE